MIRLHKWLAEQGVASRRKCEELILQGLVTVNGRVMREAGVQIDPEKDVIKFDDSSVRKLTSYIYVALNKPKGFVTTAATHEGKSVLELVQVRKRRLFPVGRLDKDSSGLLLLTDDGIFANKLSHPKFKTEKEYQVRLEKPCDPKLIEGLRKGVFLDGRRRVPVSVVPKGKMRLDIILNEGANRQVRRMVARFGNEVKELKRVRIGKLKLGKIPTGAWRALTDSEKKQLLEVK